MRRFGAWVLVLGLLACESREQPQIEHMVAGSESDSGTAEPMPAPPPKPLPEPSEWSLALARRAQLIPTPKDCPHMFRPSLEPLAVPRIQARNSARRVQQARRDISKVEVIESSTYRVLFEFDEATLAQLRERAERPPEWDPNERPMVELAWEVGLLIYVGDDPVPYLAFVFHDGQLYFVNEDDPWDPAVFDDDETFRDVYPIAVADEVWLALTRRLGQPDPGGYRVRNELMKEAKRCGRLSQVSGAPFPELPAAIVDGGVSER